MLNEDFYRAPLYITAGSTGQLETAVGHDFKKLYENLTMIVSVKVAISESFIVSRNRNLHN